MYIVSRRCPSPGIDPRIPIVSGCLVVLQRSTVAHSSLGLALGVAAACAAGRAPAAGERSTTVGATPSSSAHAPAYALLNRVACTQLTIAPRAGSGVGSARCPRAGCVLSDDHGRAELSGSRGA